MGLHTLKNLPSMNNNAIDKLHEAQLCTLFCLVPRAPVLHGGRECCMSIWLLHATPQLFPFYSLQKVSGHQILEACLRSLKGFLLCLEISCSHTCFKENQIWRFKSHGSQIVLPLFYFIILFSREGYLFFQRVFIVVHQIFISFFFLQENSSKVGIKLHERIGAFCQNAHSAPRKVICASFVCCAFFFEVHPEPWLPPE